MTSPTSPQPSAPDPVPDSPSAPVLEVADLTVDYPQRGGRPLRAVDHLSFGLRAGETLALVGESGSGKSTVVRALARLQRPSSGTVRLDGRPRTGAAAYRREVQMVFQDPFASLNPRLTVAETLGEVLSVHRLCPKRELARHVADRKSVV